MIARSTMLIAVVMGSGCGGKRPEAAPGNDSAASAVDTLTSRPDARPAIVFLAPVSPRGTASEIRAWRIRR